MNEVRKGTYITGVKDEDGGDLITTEKGFTFQEETGQELAFDIHEIEGAGTALLFGNQIFFLKFWTDEQLDKASEGFNAAIKKEKGRRSEIS
jgi:hypothetical protein